MFYFSGGRQILLPKSFNGFPLYFDEHILHAYIQQNLLTHKNGFVWSKAEYKDHIVNLL